MGDIRHDFPSLWMYPVARLTVAMGLGVWAVDGLWTALKGWCVYEGLLTGLGLVAVGLLVLYRWGNKGGKGFGLLTALAFFLWGGVRVAQERLQLDVDWEQDESVYVGRVLTAPAMKGKVFQTEVWIDARMALESYVVGAPDSLIVPVARKILLYGMPDSLQGLPEIGDRLVFAGKVGRPASEVELTGFDYGAYLYRKGVSGTAMAFRGNWMVVNETGHATMDLRQRALRCREWIVKRYRSWDLGEEELAVVSALTVGDKRVLSDSLKERYSAAGVSHVLALSGLHVGILSAVLYGLLFPLKRWRRGRILQSLLVIGALWGFAFVTGLSPSVIRAVSMCSLYFLAGCVLEEGFAGPYTLVLTGFLMLNVQPMYLFDVSCQLSFLAVASILYFYPLFVQARGMGRRLAAFPRPLRRVLQGVWKGMAVSLAAQLGTLPLILFYFGTFPTYFLVANLVVGVLAGCVLCGTLVALLATGIPLLGTWAVAFVQLATGCMNGIPTGIHDWTGAQVGGLTISVWQSCCGFVLLMALYRFLHSRRPGYLVVVLLALNVSLVDWTVGPLQDAPPMVYLYRSKVYVKHHGKVEEVAATNGLYCIQDRLRIAVLTDERWKDKHVEPRIEVDYLYVCRGCKGRLREVLHNFQADRIILDASLSDWQRTAWKEESQAAHLPCDEMSPEASYRIPW